MRGFAAVSVFGMRGARWATRPQDYGKVIFRSASSAPGPITLEGPNPEETSMKTALPALVAAALLAAPAYAGMHEAGHAMAQAAAATEAKLAEATVKKVDKAAGKVTLDHGPLENLGMPGMTMSFRVKDRAWLEQMKAGDKIRFLAEQVGGAYTVVRYEPAK